jgi:signal transduction histidine kinase
MHRRQTRLLAAESQDPKGSRLKADDQAATLRSVAVKAEQSQGEADRELAKGARRARLTLLTMGLITVGAAVVSMGGVYAAGVAQQRARVRELARSQANLIEAVARFDAVESRDVTPAGAWVATLGQVADGFSRWNASDSDLDMFVLGRAGQSVVVHVYNGRLFAPRSVSPPDSLPRALLASVLGAAGGETEYETKDGSSWLAVHEPVPSLGMAVLIQLDLSVVHGPLREAVWVSALASLVLVALGAFLAQKTSVGTVRQLSVELRRRIEVEDELSRHRDALERTVAARTSELHEAQAELLAKERLATIGQLTAKVSHELRNPLGTVRTTLHTLRERSATDVALERLWQRAERNVERCNRIIGELLTFTRPQPRRTERVELIELVREVLGDYSPPDGLQLTLDIEGRAELLADPEDLRRIVINLVNNAAAAHAPKQEALAVTVSVKQEHEGIVIRVSDDGAGMSAEVLERAFEPLFSTRGFGIGLGLPIVRELAERNGGVVRLSSVESKGTLAEVIFAQRPGDP